VVRRRAAEVGVVPDVPARSFTPHVTVVRSRSRRRLTQGALVGAREVTAMAPDQTVSVSSVRVFSSSLGRFGPTYTEIAEVPLMGGHTP